MICTIHLKSTKYYLIYLYALFIKKIAKREDFLISCINLPRKKKRITVLKSPHVHKKSKEAYESRIYHSTIFIKNVKGFDTLAPIFNYKPNEILLKFFINK